MTSPLIRYELDPTGTNPDNSVVNEAHTLSTTQIRAMVPTYGPFFSDSLQVYDVGTGSLLVRGTQYQCVELLQEPTLKYGKEISQVVLITDPLVSGNVKVNYQVLGGLYQFDMSGVVSLYDSFLKDNRAVDWMSILNKPTEYPPMMHNHILNDVYGFEYIVVALERIRNAIILSDLPALEAIIDWVKGMIITPAEVTAGAPVKKIVTFDVLLDYIRDVVIPDAVAAANVAAGAGGGTSGISLKDVTDYLDTIYVTSAEITAGTPVPKIVQHDKLIEFLTANKVTSAEILANLPVDKLVTFDRLLSWDAAKTGTGTSTKDVVTKTTSVSNNGNYGAAVAVSKDGSRLVVGAPNAIVYGRRRGVAYVFVWSGGTWVEEAKLVASNAFDNDNFGACVDINADGTRIIIGAPLADYGASWDAGGFYIFRRLTGTTVWEEEVFVTGGSGGAQDTTGSDVAISDDGTVIFVGSANDDFTNSISNGWVFLYYITDSGHPGTWKGLTVTSGGRRTYVADQSQIYFGSCVDMDATGTRYIAGGWGYEKTNKEYGTGSGIAGIYTASGNSWVRETWLYPDSVEYIKNGEFGWDVAMNADGSRAVVSSLMGQMNGEKYTGAVYVFSRSNTTWTQEAKLEPDAAKKYMGFGYSVAINAAGDKILVGSVDDEMTGTNAGAAYVYTKAPSKSNTGIPGWHTIPYAPSRGWSSFMNTYAVWYGPNMAGVTYNFTAKVTISTAGNYTIKYQADDVVTWSIDGSPNTVLSDKFRSTDIIGSTPVTLTAGDHSLKVAIYNSNKTTATADFTGNPTGVAMTIEDSNGVIIWSTKDDVAESGGWSLSGRLSANDGLGGDNFGSSLAMDGTGELMVIGAQFATVSGVAGAGKVYTFGSQPTGPTLTETIILTAQPPIANAKFGSAVAISSDGKHIVVGAPYSPYLGKISGVIGIFDLDPATGWKYNQINFSSDAAANDLYGCSVAISADGSIIAVGAYGAPSGTVADGQVYVLKRSNGGYQEQTILKATGSTWLGYSVAVSGDGKIIAAGAPNTAPSKAGTAYVFSMGSTDWTSGTTYTAIPDSVAGDNYGWSVAINTTGDTVVVGAPLTNQMNLTDSGSATLWSKTSGTWSIITKLGANDAKASSAFGYSVAMNAVGDKIIVGAQAADAPGKANTGAAYIFEQNPVIPSNWAQKAKLVPSILDPDCNYGYSVAMNAAGDKVVVGALDTNLPNMNLAGVTYVHTYDPTKGSWSTAPITASDKAASANFGTSVTCDSTGNIVAIGARGAKTTANLTNAGAVYVYS